MPATAIATLKARCSRSHYNVGHDPGLLVDFDVYERLATDTIASTDR